MTEQKTSKISRPRQLYTGKNKRDFVMIQERKNKKEMFPGKTN